MSGAIETVVSVATKASSFLGQFSTPLTIASTIYQYTQARKSQKEADKQQKIEEAKARAQQRVSDVEAEKARKEMIRRRMVAGGEVLTTAAAGGTAYGGTSSFTGAMGSLTSQYAQGITDINTQQELGQGLSGYNQQLGQSQTRQLAYATNIKGAELFSKAIGKLPTGTDIYDIKKTPTKTTSDYFQIG